MRIALVSPYDWSVFGGVNSHVRHLASEFRRRGHEADIFAPASDPETAALEGVVPSGRPVPVRAAGSTARITFRWRPGAVRAALRRGQYDIVHVHEPAMPALVQQFLGEARCPLVGTFHAAREGRHPLYRIGAFVERPWLRRLDGHIAVSPASRELSARYIRADYELIPNGIDFDHFASPVDSPPEIDDQRPTVLFVGRPEPRKGLAYLLRAWERVLAVSEGTPRLVVVGAGEFTRFERDAPPGVLFRSWVPYGDLPRYYQAATIACAPNTGNESQGYVLLEAMAAARPVVASDIPGFRSVVTSGENGLLVPPRDPHALAEAILMLLASPELRARLSEAARRRAERFRWSRVAGEVLDYYARSADRWAAEAANRAR